MNSQLLLWVGECFRTRRAMANVDAADAEENALQCLLDAFPSAPLDLIASAFIQADSDPDLAAELLSFSLNGISSKLPHPHRVSHANTGAPAAKQSHASTTFSHGRPLLRPKGPSPPTLEEYFPASPEKNAWMERLADRLQRNVSSQDQQDTSPVCDIQCEEGPDEFPCLEAAPSKEKNNSRHVSGLPLPLRSNIRSSSGASAAFGLASSARSRSCKEFSTKTVPVQKEGLASHFKQLKMKDEVKLLGPTETEGALLSMLGDQCNLDLEAVRDVLRHYGGDLEKSFEVLSQLNLPPSRSDHAPRSVLELKAVEETSTSSIPGAGVHERNSTGEEQRDSPHLAKVILESLFSAPQEVSAESQENHKHSFAKKKGEKAVKPPEMPEWKAITSTELDISGDVQGNEQVKAIKVTHEENEGERSSYGDWDSYERHHASAKEHWKTMQTYLKAATAAYAESKFSKAELLTKKADTFKQLSMEAKERANSFLLEMKSQQNESDFTLDLQEQHVMEALQLLRLHLKFFSSIPSCHTFTVITGSQEDTRSGNLKLKNEVVGYLRRKGYTLVETSPFCLHIHLRKKQQL